jgi:hypothetical protein
MEMFRSVSTTDTRDARSRFVAEVARGLATFSAEDLRGGCLTLPFGLSAWMKRADMDVSGAIESLIVLRSALLEASGLEAQCEPVPLLARDPKTAAINLAVYLHGLLQRAANFARTSRIEIATAALDCLS